MGRTEVPDPDWQDRNTENTMGDRNTQVATGQRHQRTVQRNDHDTTAGPDPAVNIEMQNLGGFDEDVEATAGLQLPRAQPVSRQHIQADDEIRAIGFVPR